MTLSSDSQLLYSAQNHRRVCAEPMETPFVIAPQLDKALTLLLELSFRVVVQRANQWLQKNAGLNRRELWVLLAVDGTQLSQRQLGEILRIHPNVMVKIIDGMERKGLIKRVRPTGNRRQYIIETTSKGLKRTQFVIDNRDTAMQYVFSPLNLGQIENAKGWMMAILRGSQEAVMLTEE